MVRLPHLDDAQEQVRRRLSAELEKTSQARQRLKADWRSAVVRVRQQHRTSGIELGDLAAYESFVLRRDRALSEQQSKYESRLAEQWTVYSEARRQTRLLERLRERRLKEWMQESEKQLEAVGSDAFLSQFKREVPRQRRGINQTAMSISSGDESAGPQSSRAS